MNTTITSPSAVDTAAAPAAVGPYSQAIIAGDTIYVSGQLPIDPASGQAVAGGYREQAAQSLANIAAILAAAGSSMDKVVKTTAFLTDVGQLGEVNEAYAVAFGDGPLPARSAFQVVALPTGAHVEIEAIAVR